jgi:hypothetical protein
LTPSRLKNDFLDALHPNLVANLKNQLCFFPATTITTPAIAAIPPT